LAELGPLGKNAVDWARVTGAVHGFGLVGIARNTTEFSRDGNIAGANLRTSTTAHAALAPARPRIENAVNWARESIAVSLLVTLGIAIGTTIHSCASNPAVTGVGAAVAGLGAVIPGAPLLENTVDWVWASIGVAVLILMLVGIAFNTAKSDIHRDAAVARLGTCAAGGGAAAPGTPLRKDAINWALLSVAVLVLVLVGIASDTTVGSGDIDRAIAGLGASGAALRAGTPRAPRCENAVDWARGAIADLSLAQGWAADTTVGSIGGDLAGARLLGTAAAHATLAPGSPLADLAVNWACVGVAWLSISEAGASSAIGGWLGGHCTITGVGTTAACLGASVEGGPLRNGAVIEVWRTRSGAAAANTANAGGRDNGTWGG